MREFFRSLGDPGYWRWRWLRVGVGSRAGLAVLICCLIGIGGYFSAVMAGSAQTDAAFEPPTQKLVTLQETVVHRVNGTGRVVTEVKRVAVPSPPQERVVTVRREGETVVEVVTVSGAGRDRVVTNPVTRTIVTSRTVQRPVTTTVDGAGRTVTEQVTAPGRTVTIASSPVTITNTVTQAPRTVTETTTDTVTTTATETTTETVSVTVTVPCRKPC